MAHDEHADMTDAKRSRRFFLAGLLAPAAGGVWAGLYFSIFMAAGGDAYQWPPTFLFMAALASAYAAVVALVLTWTIGLAWHALAYANGWRSVWAYAGFGSGTAASIALLIYILSGATWTTATFLGLFWLGTTGAVIALVGWLIRRPDRDAQPNPPTSAS
jgi:hypothetical protein